MKLTDEAKRNRRYCPKCDYYTDSPYILICQNSECRGYRIR